VQTFDVAVLAEGVEDVVLLNLLVQVGGDEDPSFDSCVGGDLHFRGQGDSLNTLSLISIIKPNREMRDLPKFFLCA
jgi:hypothetical protein